MAGLITFPSELATHENFGIELFNINEIASMVCRCMLCEGEIDVEFDKDYVSLFEPEEEIALKKHIEDMSEKLVKAINDNILEAEVIRRDFYTDKIIKEETYLNFSVVIVWLEERGISVGDLYYDDYCDFIAGIYIEIEKVIENERLRKRNLIHKGRVKDLSNKDIEKLYFENLALRNELEELRLEKQANENKKINLNPKRKDSLNKLVLAMAIKKYGYNPKANKNNSTSNIETALACYGINMDKNTIRACLNSAYEDLADVIILDDEN